MKYVKRILIIGIAIIITCPFLIDGCAADQGTQFIVDNQTSQAIIISVNHDPLNATIEPGKQKSFIDIVIPPADAPWAPSKYLFEAKTKEGQIIFSKEYTRSELEDLKYKIVIKPS
jgi:hypothetical protein